MTRLKDIFVDGELSESWKLRFQIVGVICAISTVFFLDDLSDWRPWLLACFAIIFGYGASMAGLMKKWGYRPFTNDPLGWRKAKQSYKVDASSDGESSSEDQAPKP